MKMIGKLLDWLFPIPESTFEKILYTIMIMLVMALASLFALLAVILLASIATAPLVSFGYFQWTCVILLTWVLTIVPIIGIVRLAKFGISIWKSDTITIQA